MIIPALNAYYQRLANDESVDIAPRGFSRQKIVIQVVVSKDGGATIQDAREQTGKKLFPRQLIVPGGAKPSGSGINPCFLWDNTAYALGYKPDDPKPERTLESFNAFRDKHLKVENEINDPHYSLVCTFLKGWDPSTIADSIKDEIDEIGSGFCVFRIQGETTFVHNRSSIKKWWIARQDSGGESNTPSSQCLASGLVSPIARLHEPKIKGVSGAQSAGASIVSFNFDASESYGKEQGYNAPVSEQVAFQYSTALNRLLNSKQRIQIGDATTVFWTESPTSAESWLPFTFGAMPPEDEGTKQQLAAILKTIRAGGYPDELGDQATDFYVLGLSPNAARISIRFWFRGTLGELASNLGQHFADLAIGRSEHDPEFPTFWQILRETARESKDIPPLLSGALMRSVIANSPYPQSLYTAMLRRIKADRRVVYIRAAIVKACLNRNSRIFDPSFKEMSMSLDPERKEPAYHMGRLFAQLEKAQEDAQPGINETIKDRYFSSASATPSSVFPRIIRLNQHHIGKLEKGSKVYHERRIQEICSRFDLFPPNLNLHDQGLFALGYYHQRQDIFTRKSNATGESDES